MGDGFGIILVSESLLRHVLNLGCGEAVAHKVVDKKVMQLVWSYLVLRLLCYLSVLVCWQQLG